MNFEKVLDKYRKLSFSERDKGDRFERLIQTYLQTDPKYAHLFKHVWMWSEFPARKDFGGKDTGIDIVAITHDGDYWAIQCKCYSEDTIIDKKSVDSFLSTSSRHFKDVQLKTTEFSQRLWISTTNKWGTNAEESIKNQSPPVTRLNLYDLSEAPVDWEKLDKGISGDLARTTIKKLFPHQTDAVRKANEYYKKNDRGKLIMACGTGKTLTALRIAENETNRKGLILFLVPSIALLGQTLREWYSNSEEQINPICICSDSKITKKYTKNIDSDNMSVIDLALPASTDVKNIVQQLTLLKNNKKAGMTVVFSTYQSIDVIAQAQKKIMKNENGYSKFDLIICDEAHRTTGVALSEEDSSSFIKVHDNDFIKSNKRLYMTATPRLYSDESKSKTAQHEAIICSMDDVSLYGDEIYRIGFGESVERDLLSDYKVLILTLSEEDITPTLQKIIANSESEINTDDASKLIGCINALSKQVLGDEGLIKTSDPDPMKRAVSFCQNIKVSKRISNMFNIATETYLDSINPEKKELMVSVSSEHIDGTMSAPQRDELLGWLKSTSADSNECRILNNVRCLSEGVDVPSLDAVMFLSARNSQIDVVQSVGRVMRKAPGKKYGYIIIPVIVPSDVEPSKALDDNVRFRVVWTVLNALRAHDDRFNATINKIELNKKKPNQIIVGSPDFGLNNDLSDKSDEPSSRNEELNKQLSLQFEQLQGVVFAKMVQKVGDRIYWEKWAKDVAVIAERQIERIHKLITIDSKHREAFDKFLSGLQKNINPSVNTDQAVEMLSQHIITKPVFEALFEDYSFIKNNPISKSMQKIMDLLEEKSLEKDHENLQKFYDSVRKRAEGIDNAEGKQRIIIELYDKFFKTAFPKMAKQLGIVYTPIEVVDFIIHSVNEVLKKEFGRNISDENIHMLDPFTGTGTFISRLLQSGLIEKENLKRKYEKEIHANEIVLLAYYIAAVNIENAYNDKIKNLDVYKPFEGIVLTDTFQLGETEDSEKLFSEMFPQNSSRVKKQMKAPLRIIIGNPPYYVGQKSANDYVQNQKYNKLDRKIANTYVNLSSAGLTKSLYNTYIKAYRWSTDRLDPKNGGIIAFITNGAWIDSNSTDGFRKTLEKEFSTIWVFNLRGNQRTSGELSRKEGGKIFGSGSRNPIAITILVKNPNSLNEKADIYYHDIGDYLSREDKLDKIKNFRTINHPELTWEKIIPNEKGDWLNQRNDIFSSYIPIAPDKKFQINTQSYFVLNGPGISTARDPWVYNYSKFKVRSNMKDMINVYNNEMDNFINNNPNNVAFNNFVDNDPKKISWTAKLKNDLMNGVKHKYVDSDNIISYYRPFNKQHLFFNKSLIERPGINSLLFLKKTTENMAIGISSTGTSDGLSILMTNEISDYHLTGDTKFFPLYYYEYIENHNASLFDKLNERQIIRRDGISDFILKHVRNIYSNKVNKKDIFYYVYGILHSKDYRITFENDLRKDLPRIPLVEETKHFWEYCRYGKELALLHTNYEELPPYDDLDITGLENEFYKVEKMRFPNKTQKDKIIYNSKIVISNIPTKAYEYLINGKSAIEWIMERYQVTTDKASRIKNDPNDWADEVGNPRYVLDLLLSIINLSVQTVDIVDKLPKLNLKN